MYLDEIAQQIVAELEPGDLPDFEGVERLLRSYAVLVRVKGTDVSAEDVHDAWAAWMADFDINHPALVPFAELDEATREEDEPFLMAVRAVAGHLGG